MIPPFQSTDTSNTRLLERVMIDGKAGDEPTPVAPNRPVSVLLVSVKQGAIDIHLGSGGAAGLGRVPHLHFGQTNRPEWVPIFCGQYEFLIAPVGNAGQAVQASIFFGGPDR